MSSNEQKLIKISEIIMRNIQRKYPSAYEQVGLTQESIISVLEKKRDLLDSKEGLTHIINIIDQVVRTKINGPNSILHNTDTTKFSMDTETTIPHDTYANQNLDMSSAPSFKLNPKDNPSQTMSDTVNKPLVSSSNFNDGGVLQTYQEENILDSRMNTQYYPKHSGMKIKLHVDSKDRDFDNYSAANGFEIDLSDKALGRIRSIKLTDVILIDSSQTDMSSDNLSIPPYLLLEISGLPERRGGNNSASNENLENTFAVLRKYELQNGYKYYTDLSAERIFKNTVAIDKLGITFRLPDGSLFNFGETNNELRRTVSLLSFDIELE
jgi:hypothetical protein